MQCECEVNDRVQFIELPNIEENINTNVYILDMRDIYLLLKLMLMYIIIYFINLKIGIIDYMVMFILIFMQ